MTLADNIATVRRFYEAGPSDDDAQRYPYASADIVWHVPGANHVSGTYVGASAVFEEMPAKMRPLDDWTLQLGDIMANADLVVATVQIRGRRGSIVVDCAGAHVFRIGADGLIAEAWGFVDDQSTLDALFDSGAAPA